MYLMLHCTNRCNFNCTYCFQKRPRATRKGTLCLDDLATIYRKLRVYLSRHSKPGERVCIEWTGGEPLTLGHRYFTSAFEMQRSLLGPHAERIKNYLQTNGSLIDDSFAQIFKQYSVEIGVSIDFARGVRLIEGRNTSRAVFSRMKFLRKQDVSFGCIVVVTQKNVRHLLEIYRRLRDEQIVFQFNYLYHMGISYGTELEPDLDVLAEKMAEVVREYVRDLDHGKIIKRVPSLDNEINIAVNNEPFHQTICQYSRICFSDFLSIETDGSAYPCSAFTTDYSYLGNIYKSSIRSLLTHKFKNLLKK